MRDTVGAVLDLVGYTYDGVDPVSLEPSFTTPNGTMCIFDRLPHHVRHLLCVASFPIKTLWAAYPGEDPRTAQGVIAVDELDPHQPLNVAGRMIEALREVLARVPWIFTTSSAEVAASIEAGCAIAVRQLPEHETVDVFAGHARPASLREAKPTDRCSDIVGPTSVSRPADPQSTLRPCAPGGPSVDPQN